MSSVHRAGRQVWLWTGHCGTSLHPLWNPVQETCLTETAQCRAGRAGLGARYQTHLQDGQALPESPYLKASEGLRRVWWQVSIQHQAADETLATTGAPQGGLVLGSWSAGLTLVMGGPELQPELCPFPGQSGLWPVHRAG